MVRTTLAALLLTALAQPADAFFMFNRRTSVARNPNSTNQIVKGRGNSAVMCRPGEDCSINSRGGITGTAPARGSTAAPTAPRQRPVVSMRSVVVKRVQSSKTPTPAKPTPEQALAEAINKEADLARQYYAARQARIFRQKLALAAKNREIAKLVAGQRIATQIEQMKQAEAKALLAESELKALQVIEQHRLARANMEAELLEAQKDLQVEQATAAAESLERE